MKRVGFGQVEANHLSAQRTGQIYAQLPAKNDINLLENGQFVKYNYADGVVDFEGEGEWMLVYNEVKLYDAPWRESYKDFAMIKDNYTPGSDSITHDGLGPFKGQMTPRLFKTNIGDIFTTNCLEKANTSGKAEVTLTDLTVGDVVAPTKTNGYLKKSDSGTTTDDTVMKWQVVKLTTMPDGQAAVKLMRIL